jgi:hypothetical protein
MTTEFWVNLQHHPMPALEVRIGINYLTLAVIAFSRREWVRGGAYLAAAGLTFGLAACMPLH